MDDDLKRYVDKLGDEYGTLFFHCYQDIAHLRLTWKSYKSLFGTNEERYKLLYSVSDTFSYVMRKALLDSTLLGVRRLTDPYTQKIKGIGVRNVSIRGFAGLFQGESDEWTFKEILDRASNCADAISEHINKKVAHADFAVREGEVEVSNFSRRQIEEAIENIAMVIKWVARQKMNTSVSTIPGMPAEDELWFLQHLYEGVNAMKQKEARRRELSLTGNYQARDALYKYPEWLMRVDEERFDLLD